MSTDGIHFLGIASKVQGFRAGGGIACVGVAGLTRAVGFPFFPWDLSGNFLIVALPVGRRTMGKFELRRSDGQSLFSVTLEVATGENPQAREVPGTCLYAIAILVDGGGGVLLTEPDRLDLVFESAGLMSVLGCVDVLFSPPPLITEEQRLALQSQPGSFKSVHFTLASRRTNASITAVVALDRESVDRGTPQEAIWYQDLPDYFAPEGEMAIPLRYLRDGMHWLLLNHESVTPDGKVSTASLYTHGQVQETLREFRKLLDSEPEEERVQRYLEKNLVLLSHFAARHLLVKPPILNKYRADFGIVNALNELILIEIERPSMQLFRKDGATGAALSTPFDQIRSWFQEIDRDRDAALRCLPGRIQGITAVKGVVIAGRSKPGEAEFLGRFQGAADASRIAFMTYDQLISSSVSVLRHAGLASPGLVYEPDRVL